jgi:hypothetical protein
MFGKHWAEHQKSSFSKGIHFSLVWFCVVRWDKEGTVKAGDYSFSMGKEMKIISWEQGFLYITE